MLDIQTSRPCNGLPRARRQKPAAAPVARRTRPVPVPAEPAPTVTASVMTAFVEPIVATAPSAVPSPARRHRSEQALVSSYLAGLVV